MATSIWLRLVSQSNACHPSRCLSLCQIWPQPCPCIWTGLPSLQNLWKEWNISCVPNWATSSMLISFQSRSTLFSVKLSRHMDRMAPRFTLSKLRTIHPDLIGYSKVPITIGNPMGTWTWRSMRVFRQPTWKPMACSGSPSKMEVTSVATTTMTIS